jgi:hypothetical protein
MYILYSFTKFSLSILKNDPKRNYQKKRIIVFYLKVFINTISNYNKKKKYNSEIVYCTPKKEIYFKKKEIIIEYKDSILADKYKLLVENRIIKNTTHINNNNFKQLLFTPEKNIIFNSTLLKNIIKANLIKLYKIKLKSNDNYFSDLRLKISRIKLIELHSVFIRDLSLNKFSQKVNITYVHGDFWSGNIIKSSAEIEVIDWDDLGIKSFSYDVFYFYFQENNCDLLSFSDNYESLKNTITPILTEISDEINVGFKDTDYQFYWTVFIVERIIKMYEK